MTRTPSLIVPLGGRAYPIHIASGLLQDGLVLEIAGPRKLAVITNTVVQPLYADRLAQDLEHAGHAVQTIVLPDGEAFKNHESLNLIYDALLAGAFDRKSCIIAVGGGVVGDVAGFAAATFQRGIPFIQIPTTLLAQVDSSVGGKTAINHPMGKNMIGAFHQPIAVVIDTGTLATLPDREFNAGLAEVIKYGLIRDPELLVWLESNMAALRHRDVDALHHAIYESCRNKAEVVANDELETGDRALLNLGHTFGHAIEGALGFGNWLHGEAVAVGLILAAELSKALGHLDANDVMRVKALIQAAGLPLQPPALPAATLLRFMDIDKKNEGGAIRLILLRKLGDAYIDKSVSREHLREFLTRSAQTQSA